MKVFYRICEEDLQDVAQEQLARPLTHEEMKKAKKYFENGLNWYETAWVAVQSAVEDSEVNHAKKTA